MTIAAVAPAPTPQVIVRDGIRSDYPLLSSSFVTSYCSDSRSVYGYGVPSHTLVQKLEQLRDSPNWKLLVACPNTEPDEILGMLLFRPDFPTKRHPDMAPAVAWVMTKYRYQKKGVAKALFTVASIPKGPLDAAFVIPSAARILNRLGYTIRFRPYLPDVELWNELNR